MLVINVSRRRSWRAHHDISSFKLILILSCRFPFNSKISKVAKVFLFVITIAHIFIWVGLNSVLPSIFNFDSAPSCPILLCNYLFSINVLNQNESYVVRILWISGNDCILSKLQIRSFCLFYGFIYSNNQSVKMVLIL